MTAEPSHDGTGKYWALGLVGVVALIAWATNENSASTVTNNDLTPIESTQNTSEVAEAPPSVPSTVDEGASGRAARHHQLAINAEGISGAQIYSVNCYASLQRTFEWVKLDQCGIFDAVTTLALKHDPALVNTESDYFNVEADLVRFNEAAQTRVREADVIARHYSLIKGAAVLSWKPAGELETQARREPSSSASPPIESEALPSDRVPDPDDLAEANAD